MKAMVIRPSDEAGEIMIESTIIVLLTTFILIFMVSLGFLYYQKSVMNTVVNEVATEVGQSYKYVALFDKDITTKDEMLFALDRIPLYRYGFFNWIMETNAEKKTEVFAVARLSKTSLAKQEGTSTILITSNASDFGRRYVVVSVEAKYSIFWGGALEAFGMDSDYLISSTAYAECNDVSNYYNTVQFAKYACDKIKGNAAISAVDAMLSLFKSVFPQPSDS